MCYIRDEVFDKAKSTNNTNGMHLLRTKKHLPKETEGEKILNEKIKNIAMNNLSFSYNGHKREIISEMNYSFCTGNIYLIVGENGAGKTTMARLLSGLYKDEIQGIVTINGINFKKYNMKKIRHSSISFVEQDVVYIEKMLEASQNDIDMRKFMEVVRLLDSERFLDVDKKGYFTLKNKQLSGGEKQKLAIALGLAQNKSLIILDEPTAALDAVMKKRVMQYIRNIIKEEIFIVISHEKEWQSYAGEIIVL